MLKITKRDKIFTIIALPVLTITAYWYFFHRDIAARAEKLEAADSSLPTKTLLDAQRGILEQRLSQSSKELAQLYQKAAVDDRERGTKQSPAERFQNVVETFNNAGAPVIRAFTADTPNPWHPSLVELRGEGFDDAASGGILDGAVDGNSVSSRLLREATAHDSPVIWTLGINASYGTFVAALKSLASKNLPIIIETISLADSKAGRHWTVTLWL